MAEPADFRSQRLFVEAPLAAAGTVTPNRSQAHYLVHVLRLRSGDDLRVFNGSDGEWLARILATNRKSCTLQLVSRIRAQPDPSDLWYLFAPLKQARMDYMIQKATEMGAGRLVPVLTHHTQIRRVNGERMRANAVEAAEQCGILSVPDIAPPRPLEQVLADWPQDRHLIFCDEATSDADPVAALSACGPDAALAVLIGPEGGFSDAERAKILSMRHVKRLSLGPRILRADTAAVAALALVQSVCGDWQQRTGRGYPGAYLRSTLKEG